MRHRSIIHLDTYGAANLDGRTLVILREDIQATTQHHQRLTADISAGFRDEWDQYFAEDITARAAATATIDTELESRRAAA